MGASWRVTAVAVSLLLLLLLLLQVLLKCLREKGIG